ncbi:hypothetical protein AcV5_001654 [Taiwanofungus camphoratus]|nr:hypothetical protein AcV5_001654 [Antrodia cinnamomea]
MAAASTAVPAQSGAAPCPRCSTDRPPLHTPPAAAISPPGACVGLQCAPATASPLVDASRFRFPLALRHHRPPSMFHPQQPSHPVTASTPPSSFHRRLVPLQSPSPPIPFHSHIQSGSTPIQSSASPSPDRSNASSE